eukprot:RCo007033
MLAAYRFPPSGDAPNPPVAVEALEAPPVPAVLVSVASPSPSTALSRPRSRRRSIKNFITRSAPVCGHAEHHRLECFTSWEELGSGATGVVYRTVNTCTHGTFAVKQISIQDFTKEEVTRTLQEVYIMKSLAHPNVVRLHTYYVEKRSLFMVMEWCDMGDLEELVETYRSHGCTVDEAFLWRVLSQLCSALQYLHESRIIHRDVKTRNVLLMGPELAVKLADLGLSRMVSSQPEEASAVGTPSYFAPEQVQRLPCDYKVDIWAAGCVLYRLSTLAHPFSGSTVPLLFRSILNSTPAPLPSQYSELWRACVMLCLTKDPDARPGIQEVLRCRPGSSGGNPHGSQSEPRPRLHSPQPEPREPRE